ncbi:MAG: hypothetical protein AB7O21_04995 [Gammaproteobacteria bacterium]
MNDLRPSPPPTLHEKVAFLRDPAHYPHPVQAVDVIETHMSWVFLTDGFVYKLKKPITRAAVDFATLDARQRHCHAEIALNRRLAPDVYLGVTALTRDNAGHLAIDGDGEIVEWLVKMRRLDTRQMLDALIREHRLTRADLAPVTALLCAFYRAAPRVPCDPHAYVRRFERDFADNLAELAHPRYRLAGGILRTLGVALPAACARTAPLLAARARDGRIVEGHGDLRPEHLYLGTPPVVIDCLEFDSALRVVDPVDEFAYLGLECEVAGVAWVGPAVLQAYADACAEVIPPALTAFYTATRAVLRAKLSAWHLLDCPVAQHARWLARAARYLELAAAYAARARPGSSGVQVRQ